MNIEGTPLQQAEFARVTARLRAAEFLLQQLENDPEYPVYPPHFQEDYVWYRLNDMEDHNALPYDYTAYELYSGWIQKRLPDAKIIHLGNIVSKPFYE